MAMSKSSEIALAQAQAIRSLLQFPVWSELWSDHFDEPTPELGSQLADKIELCLAAKQNEVSAIVDADKLRSLPLLLKHIEPSEAEFLLALAAIRCCLEAAVFLEAAENGLGASIPAQHNLIFGAWKSFRRCLGDKRSHWPLNEGPLHFGPGWQSY